MRFVVDERAGTPLAGQRVEVVERKGIGHPDTICDMTMEAASRALSRRYLETHGRVLHHNLDKAFLVAGRATPRFGGGVVDEPMRLIMGDRATYDAEGIHVPVGDVARDAAALWMRANLRYVDPDRHVAFQNEIKPGAPELQGIFERATLGANDTSAAVGYAPLTPCERLVLDTEAHINGSDFHEEFPEAGEDVKVMAMREGDDVRLVIAVAFVDRFVPSEEAYFSRKAQMRDAIERHARAATSGFDRVEVALNTLDRKGAGTHGVYLTVLGTSAESGDSGQVGRGNRSNGFTNASRPMSAEAVAGKNAVSHVGKIYTLLADEIAGAIHASVPGIAEVYVRLCSRIGDPLDEPALAAVDVRLEPGASMREVEPQVRRVANEGIANVDGLVERLLRGEVRVA